MKSRTKKDLQYVEINSVNPLYVIIKKAMDTLKKLINISISSSLLCAKK